MAMAVIEISEAGERVELAGFRIDQITDSIQNHDDAHRRTIREHGARGADTAFEADAFREFACRRAGTDADVALRDRAAPGILYDGAAPLVSWTDRRVGHGQVEDHGSGHYRQYAGARTHALALFEERLHDSADRPISPEASAGQHDRVTLFTDIDRVVGAHAPRA